MKLMARSAVRTVTRTFSVYHGCVRPMFCRESAENACVAEATADFIPLLPIHLGEVDHLLVVDFRGVDSLM